jgi:hypothetical protein
MGSTVGEPLFNCKAGTQALKENNAKRDVNART